MTSPSTGRGIGNILALSTIVTVIIALPVLLNPQTFIFGVETVGRHYDPFRVMQQFALGGASGIVRQPLVDDLGAWLAKGIGPIAAYNLIVLITFPAAAAATYALARFLTGVHRSSLVAALAFAFAPVHGVRYKTGTRNSGVAMQPESSGASAVTSRPTIVGAS